MTHHFAMTMAFDASLRSSNPKVTMPYWDFTIEGEKILDAGGDPNMLFDVTPMFNATWFGDSNDEHHIADGRWAHTKSPVAQADDIAGLGPNVANSFGIIRAPWNNSPEPEMARAQSRGVPVASHAAMVADALREAQRAVDDVVRRLRVVAGDARRAN